MSYYTSTRNYLIQQWRHLWPEHSNKKPLREITEHISIPILPPDASIVPYQSKRQELRFEQHEYSICIRGFPPPNPNCPSYHYMLDRPMPAQLNYILDPDWRERLMVTTFNYRDVKEYTYIRAPDDPEDEAEHCLRMRRCGADALLYNVTTHVLQERLSAASAMQIMGWPSSGGVWMYRVPQSWYAGKSLEERFAGAPPYSQMGLDNPAVMLEKVNGDLRGCGGMDEFCEVLRGYGGVYFGDVRKCRAVVGLRLVDARGSGEFVKWVFERLGDEDTRLMSSTTRYIGTTKVWDPNGSKEFLEGEEDEEF